MEWHWVVYLIVVQLQQSVDIYCVSSVDSPRVLKSLLINPQKSSTSVIESHSNVLQALEDCSCGLAAFVFIEDSRLLEFSKHTLHLFPAAKFSMIHYIISHMEESSERIRSIIWNSYSQHCLTDFIVLTNYPECVIKIATDIFQRNRRGSGALMTNRVRFVIVTLVPVQDLQPLFKSVIFDNIAVVVVNENTLEVSGVYTLMWRSKASREFESVTYVDKYSKLGRTSVCHIFPNMNYGLNGRTLVGLSKEWVTYLYKTSNQVTGQMMYAGFSATVIETLSRDLNFSYNLVPQPGMDDALTWKDYELLIQNQGADFGADLYISNMMTYLNTTVSFPVISGDIRGIYKQPGLTEASHFDVLINSRLYVGVILSLFSTVGFYLLIEKCLVRGSARGMCDKAMSHNSATYVHKHRRINLSGFRKRGEVSLRKKTSRKNNGQEMLPDVETVELQEIAIVDTVQTNRMRNATAKCHICKNTLNAGMSTENSKTNIDRKRTNLRLNSSEMLIGQRRRNISPRRGIGMLKRFRTKGNVRKRAEHNVSITNKTSEDSSSTSHELDPLKHRNNSIVVLDISTENANLTDQFDPGIGKNLPSRIQNEIMDNKSETLQPGTFTISSTPKMYIMDTFFAFLGSVCGQGTLPSPPLFPARLLLCSWCLTLIITTAIFNGSLTADFLDKTESIPFKTFNGLLSRTDYKWGFYNESTIFKIMEFSKPGTLFHQIYSGVTKFLKTDPFVLGTFEDIHRKLMTEKFVAILDTFSQKYLENVKNLTDIIVLSDVLMTINLGYVFPKNSELESAFSKQIMKLVEHGVIEDIFRKSFPHYKREPHRKSENDDNRINLSTLIDLIRVCGIGAAISLVILILECIVAKTNVLAVLRKVFRHSMAAVKHS